MLNQVVKSTKNNAEGKKESKFQQDCGFRWLIVEKYFNSGIGLKTVVMVCRPHI